MEASGSCYTLVPIDQFTERDVNIPLTSTVIDI
jgi:hypothetical protein